MRAQSWSPRDIAPTAVLTDEERLVDLLRTVVESSTGWETSTQRKIGEGRVIFDREKAEDTAYRILRHLGKEGLTLPRCSRERLRLFVHVCNALRHKRETYHDLARWIIERYVQTSGKSTQAA